MKVINLQNKLISVEFDSATGNIVSLKDLERGSKVALESTFSMTAADHVFDPEKSSVSLLSQSENHAEFEFEDEVFAATLKYIIPEDGAFIERQLSFYRKDGKEWMIKNLVCEDLKFNDKPNELFMHDDQTLWHVPTAIFARYNGGGLYFGLEYPYWDYEEKKTNGFTLGFTPNYLVPAGEKFVAEKTFLGVYKAEGIKRYSHGPYPGVKKFKYPEVVRINGTGLAQAFADMKNPDDVGIPPEVLDWGEVWALQKFFVKYLPLLQLPEKGYFMWINGWWARITQPDLSILDELEEIGIKYVLTAAMYLGHDSHPCTEPKYISDVRIDPIGFPIYEDDDEKGDTSVPDGLHHETKASDGRKIIGYTDDFSAPKDYDIFIKEAAKRGIHIESFETPNNYYHNKPEWGSIDKDGKNHEYLGTRISCPACKEYMDFRYKLFCKIIDKYSCHLWTMDGRWISFKEFAGYGKGEIAPDPCYSDKHGHLPGDNRYMEWKNIEEFKAKIRKRYPDMCFEQYYGLKRGGIWSMSNANSDENIYECSCTDNNRFQTWFNENTRFRPVYINYTSIMGKTSAEVEYSMISAFSTSAYAQVAFAYSVLRDDPKSREPFKRWRKWGDEHHKYLLNRRCIFSYPGDKAIDGSAHIIDDEGYIFVFATTESHVDARIILNSWIGLSDDKNAKYSISLEAAVCYKDGDGEKTAQCQLPTCVKYGDTLRFRISPFTAAIIHIKKSDKGTTDALADSIFEAGDIVENAFDIE